MKTRQFKHGDKIKVILTLDAEVISNLDGVTQEALCDMVLNDEAYGLKSIIVGKIDPECEEDHDTELLLNTTTVEIKPFPTKGKQ